MIFKRKQPNATNLKVQIEELKQQLLNHKHIAWKPVVQEEDGGILASKFSGTPWLAKNEDWPQCECCGSEMNFFLQLNLESLPMEARGKGLLQMFYCTKCDSWEPFSPSHLLRVVYPDSVGNTLVALPNKAFPAKRIIAWEALEEYPGYAEWEDLAIPIQVPDIAAEAVEDMLAKEGDKLGGWPNWIQSVEYPNCPLCNKQMQLVFQIDSNDNLDFMFGDAGCGHITQCSEHKDILAFGWACC
ncbi:MAG: DUF1963 domain-containing protein [Trueperaceae bacterium]